VEEEWYLANDEFVEENDGPRNRLRKYRSDDLVGNIFDSCFLLLLDLIVHLVSEDGEHPNHDETAEHKCDADGPGFNAYFYLSFSGDMDELPIYIVGFRCLLAVELVSFEDEFISCRVLLDTSSLIGFDAFEPLVGVLLEDEFLHFFCEEGHECYACEFIGLFR
jgi:hypothetical protein